MGYKTMDKVMDFINMQGYGSYVWPSYLVTAGVLIFLLVMSQRLLKANIETKKSLDNADKKGME